MLPCPACQAMEPHKFDAHGHPALRITDTRRIKPPDGPAITVSTFACQACGARWAYRAQKGDPEQGWQRLCADG